MLFGGAGAQIGIDNQVSGTASTPTTAGGILADGTLPKDMHARDADTIVGDNGDIIRIVGINHIDVNPNGVVGQPNYVTFVYDNYGGQRLVVRGVTLLDYTPGGPDFVPANFGLPAQGTCNGSPTQPTCSVPLDTSYGSWKAQWVDPKTGLPMPAQIGGRDEVHGESGDDTVYAGADSDIIYGDAQNDDLIGGWGNDWISGGTGDDGILGDDGRLFTSRNSSTGVGGCTGNAAGTCYSEPLYGISALLATDPDSKASNGNVLNEYIYTPGQVQQAIINPAGALNKAADLTPYNLGSDVDAGLHHVADQPLFDANNSDDIIFGGWGDDAIHGGSGDDAISGSEAIGDGQNGYTAGGFSQHFDAGYNPDGIVYIDFAHPWNPGDVLHFGDDTNPWHSNNHNAIRLGEFYLYNEYDPRREIRFSDAGAVWGCTAYTPSGHTCTAAPPAASFPYLFFLNNEDLTGNIYTGAGQGACVSVDNQGNCLAYKTDQRTDGNDVIFGDLGNDWMVGGTGQDTIWAGWGNDLSNADDDMHSGCVVTANNGTCTTAGDTWLNDVPDGVNSSFQDRVFGGAGLDILIANTGGDRLIDWVGEFNSYLVPFSTFGIATVSRQVDPWLPEFLYALSRSQGADPTRATDTGDDPVRNGEPNGELGLITQHDHGQWQTQTGGPTDPQAGNIPGGRRDTVRGADFNDGTLQGFATASGTFTVSSGLLSVTATDTTSDAIAVWYDDVYKTVYYELSAKISMDKPIGGWKANAFIVFDYFGPTDFKFAGVDQSINKMVIGHRDANGWWYDAQASVPGGVKAGTFYDLNVIVNGLVVTVTLSGKNAFSYTFQPRVMPNGDKVALNKGLAGFGSNQAHGMFDNIALTVIQPEITVDRTNFFEGSGGSTQTAVSGTFTTTAGRYVGTAGTGGVAAVLIGFPAAPGGAVPNFDATSYVNLTSTFRASGFSGFMFDWYNAGDYKFVAIDVAGQRITIGHVIRGSRVIDATIAQAITAGKDYVLDIVLKATVVTVTFNGQVLASYVFNSPLADGLQGVFGTGTGTVVSIDDYRLRTDDIAYAGAPPPAPASAITSAASVKKPASGTTTVTMTVTLSAPATTATRVYWSIDPSSTAVAGTDYMGPSSGYVTIPAGSTSANITFTIPATARSGKSFIVRLTPDGAYNISRASGTVTIT
jgi:hypothetical protein